MIIRGEIIDYVDKLRRNGIMTIYKGDKECE